MSSSSRVQAPPVDVRSRTVTGEENPTKRQLPPLATRPFWETPARHGAVVPYASVTANWWWSIAIGKVRHPKSNPKSNEPRGLLFYLLADFEVNPWVQCPTARPLGKVRWIE